MSSLKRCSALTLNKKGDETVRSMGAGAGFEPASSGNGPDKEPLLYPALYK